MPAVWLFRTLHRLRRPRRVFQLLALVAIGWLAVVFSRDRAQPVTPGPAATERAMAATPPARFVDVTNESGLATAVRTNGAAGEKLLPETTGGGGALVDVDNDGDLDIVLVDGRAWPWTRPAPPAARSTVRLFTNDGTGHFTDTTGAAGLAVQRYGMGIAAGDFDNDGWTDLFITAVGQNVLLENVGGRLHDVTAQAGVGGRADQWTTCATWFDLENDGDLDLFVCQYVRWSRAIDRAQDFSLAGVGRAYGPPRNFQGSAPQLYVNQGDSRFVERAAAAGLVVADPVTKAPAAKSLGVALVHLDADRCVDLVVANDTVRNYAFRNRCDGTFEEVGATIGIAYDSYGNARSGMGIDIAEVRDDGQPAVAIGNFANEMTAFFARQGSGQFVDESIAAGIGAASRAALTFGVLFLDYDLDGRDDLVTINGHVEDQIALVQASQQHAQPAGLYWNAGPDAPATFSPVSETGALATPIIGRGGAYGDIDGDGDLDLLLVPTTGALRLLRNDTPGSGAWLRLRLAGTASNADAIGAVVELESGGRTRRRVVSRTHGYLSQSEPGLTFGFAPGELPGAIRVTWPSGAVQTLSGVPLRQTTTITEAQ